VAKGTLIVTSRGLPALLPQQAVKATGKLVDAALKDPGAVDAVEKMLPACHQAIRAALATSPKARGAAGLRQLLALFDE